MSSEHRLEILLGDAGIERHVFRRGLEKAVVVDVADDELGGLAIVRIQRGLVELPHEVLLKRFLGRDGIEKELALLFVFLRAGAVAARLRHVIAPFVIQFRQLIELGLELLVGGRRGRFFGAVRVRFGGQLFQDGIGFHFLLDQVAQLEERRLQDEQALLELGRKNLLEREVLRLMHPGPGHDSDANPSQGAKSKQLPRREQTFIRRDAEIGRNTTCFHKRRTDLLHETPSSSHRYFSLWACFC